MMRPEETDAFLQLFGENPSGSPDAVANLKHHGLRLSVAEIEEIRFEDGDKALENFSAFQSNSEAYCNNAPAEVQPFLKELIPGVQKTVEKPKKPSERQKVEEKEKTTEEKPDEKKKVVRLPPKKPEVDEKPARKEQPARDEQPPAQRFDPLPPHIVKVLESQDWFEWQINIKRADELCQSRDAVERAEGFREMRSLLGYINDTLVVPGLMPETKYLLLLAKNCIQDLKTGLFDENPELFRHRYSPRSHN